MCCCKIGFWKTGHKLAHRFGSREELGDGSCVKEEKSEGGRVKNRTKSVLRYPTLGVKGRGRLSCGHTQPRQAAKRLHAEKTPAAAAQE